MLSRLEPIAMNKRCALGGKILSKIGRPIAMQIVAPPNQEERLLKLGVLAESALAIPRSELVPSWVRFQLEKG